MFFLLFVPIITFFDLNDLGSAFKDGLEAAKGKIKDGMDAAKVVTGDLINKGKEAAGNLIRASAENEATLVQEVLTQQIRNLNSGIHESGILLKQERQTSHFEGIHVDSTINVFVNKGIQDSILVVADQNLINLVETTVSSDHILSITMGVAETKQRLNPINVNVTMSNLSYIKVSDSSSVKVTTYFQSENMKVRVSGLSFLQLPVDTNNLDAKITKASVAALYGEAKNAIFDVSGTSALCATFLEVGNANITLKGASIARVDVTNELRYNLTYFSSLRHINSDKVIDSYHDENSVVEYSKYGF